MLSMDFFNVLEKGGYIEQNFKSCKINYIAKSTL